MHGLADGNPPSGASVEIGVGWYGVGQSRRATADERGRLGGLRPLHATGAHIWRVTVTTCDRKRAWAYDPDNRRATDPTAVGIQ